MANNLLIYGRKEEGRNAMLTEASQILQEKYPQRLIGYFTLDYFSGDLLRGLAANRAEEHMECYKTFDIIIVDDFEDVKRLSNLMITLVSQCLYKLEENGNMIILGSEKPADEIEYVNEELKAKLTAMKSLKMKSIERSLADELCKTCENGCRIKSNPILEKLHEGECSTLPGGYYIGK